MIDTHRSVLESAIAKYGKTHQLWIAVEEMSELMKELCKSVRGSDNWHSIAEEIADVTIMLEQLKIIYKIDYAVEREISRKMARLKERVEE